jgi:hypothetical protein
MSEIPFVNALGDAIEIALAGESAATKPRWWTRIPRRRGARLVIVVAALGLAGAGYAVTRTSHVIADTVVCEPGTNITAPARVVFGDGRSPTSLCAQAFRARGMRALAAPGALVGCALPHDSYVVVVRANGSPTECQHLDGGMGLRPLPGQPYDRAGLRVLKLATRLRAVQDAQRCIAPQALARRARRVLRRLGWFNWRAAIEPGRRGHLFLADHRTGSCGVYAADGASFSDPVASLDQENHTVWIFKGPPRPY